MMDELRKIKDDISAHLWTLTPEERVEWLKGQATQVAENHGYELRPHPTMPNCRQMVKKA